LICSNPNLFYQTYFTKPILPNLFYQTYFIKPILSNLFCGLVKLAEGLSY
jgi:hypothetical protein